MIWALLALLGVPIWLVLGALGASLWNRRRFLSQPGVFALRVRPLESGVPGAWRRKAYGRWVRDVLLVNSGIALVRTTAYGVVSHAAATRPDPESCKGLGGEPVALAIELDDGRSFQVAAAASDARDLVLPFGIDPAELAS